MSKTALNRHARQAFFDSLVNGQSGSLIEEPLAEPANTECDPNEDPGVGINQVETIPLLNSLEDLLESVLGHSFEDNMEHEPTVTEESDDRQQETPLTLSEELLLFFVIFNLPRAAMSYLLKLLLRFNIDVPSSVYRLTKAKRSFRWDTIDINNGNIGFLTLKETIVFCIENGFLAITSECRQVLNLQINVDGLPLYKSSQVTLWPILCKIENVMRPLPLALFCGVGKPDLTEFLKRLCEELHEFMTTGFVYNGCCFVVSKVIFVCDAPARAFIQRIQGHTSKAGCGYCRVMGEWFAGRVVFPFSRNCSRTDECYGQGNENNQLGISPLSAVVGLYTSFPPDYMHAVCLGVTRKLFHYYLKPTKGQRLLCRLSLTQQTVLNDLSLKMSRFVPSEFQRRLRSFKELEHFKATEYRSLILYFGPYLLKRFLPSQFYDHFLLLHFSVYVFTSERFTHLHSCATRCMELFVANMSSLFGQQSLSYNVHILLHLSEFVSLYGTLDSFSAFPFENHLAILKWRVKKTNMIFHQSLNQLINIRSLYVNSPQSQLIFSAQPPNNCAVLNDGSFLLVSHVGFDNALSGSLLAFSRDLYVYPYPSRCLQIGFYSQSRIKLNQVYPVSKAICIPFDSDFLILPFA